jgi:hypothetical protein
MPRAGFTAIHAGRIRFGKDGRWYCDDDVIANRAICRLYARAMTVGDDGVARLQLGEDRAVVDVEDTPWVVRMVERTPNGGYVVVLNDESTEPLDPRTLRVADHVLYCRVKGGRHEVRFLRPAQYELARHADVDASGRLVLDVEGTAVPLPVEA